MKFCFVFFKVDYIHGHAGLVPYNTHNTICLPNYYTSKHIQNDVRCLSVPTAGEDSGFVCWAEAYVMKDEQSLVFVISVFALSQIRQHLQSSSHLHDHLLTVFLERDVQQQLEPLRQNHCCCAAFTIFTAQPRCRKRQEVLQEVALQSGREGKYVCFSQAQSSQ